MKRSFLIVIVSTALLISCLSPAQQKLQEGDAYLDKQDWDQAVVSYSLAGELDPQLKPAGKIAAAYAGKASSSYKNADYESAVFNFNKAAAFDPRIKADFDLGYACYMSGLSNLEKGRYQEARQVLGEAIARGYARPEAYLARAHTCNKLGMYSGAIGDATACLDIDPAAAGAYYERGFAYLASGEYQKAIADLSQSIALGSSFKDVYYYRGMAYKGAGDYRRAITDLKRAVEIGPVSTDVLVQLGRCYYLLTDYYDAIEQFTRAIELNGIDVAIAFNDRAVCRGRVGEYNAAVSDLSILLKMKPAFPLAYYNLGVVYMKMNQPPPGIENLDIYICLDRSDRYGCLGLAYGWRNHNIEYNLCCGSRAVSGYVLDRCSRLLSDYFGGQSIPFEKDALYFGTDQDRVYW